MFCFHWHCLSYVVDEFLTLKTQSTYYSEISLQVNITCLQCLSPRVYRLMEYILLARRVYTVHILFPGIIVIFSGANEHWQMAPLWFTCVQFTGKCKLLNKVFVQLQVRDGSHSNCSLLTLYCSIETPTYIKVHRWCGIAHPQMCQCA